MKYSIFSVALVVFLIGCASPQGGPREHRVNFENVVYEYNNAAMSVNIGDPKETVLRTLTPTQANLPWRYKKPPKSYQKHGVNVDIHYFRSGWISDGLVNNKEYTPYIFNNSILVGIGWEVLSETEARQNVLISTPTQSSSTIKQQVVIVY